MALQLEAQKEVMSALVLLDCGPEWKNVITSKDDFDTLLISTLWHSAQHVPLSSFQEVRKMTVLRDKFDCASKILHRYHPLEDLSEITNHMQDMLSMANCLKDYTPVGKINGLVHLIRASLTKLGSNYSKDYGLKNVCKIAPQAFEIEGDHFCFYKKVEELGIPEIVNKIF
jgi:hypothetical protein